MKKAFPALLALLCACLALLVATSSSPLYATNFWTDTNIYFTIGRGMTRGLMPYRDLFDHKGPLLFILYALGAAISDTSFIGVFALEALSLAAAVDAGWRPGACWAQGGYRCWLCRCWRRRPAAARRSHRAEARRNLRCLRWPLAFI